MVETVYLSDFMYHTMEYTIKSLSLVILHNVTIPLYHATLK